MKSWTANFGVNESMAGAVTKVPLVLLIYLEQEGAVDRPTRESRKLQGLSLADLKGPLV